jgi:hypothetical protein
MSRLVMASSEDGATTSWRKAWAARQRRAATTMDRGAQGTNVATQDQAEPWRAAATRTERLGLGTTARTERPARLREARASTSRVKHRTSMAQERTSARRCVRLASMKNGAGRAGEQKVSMRPWSLDSEQRREASRGMSRLGQTQFIAGP